MKKIRFQLIALFLLFITSFSNSGVNQSSTNIFGSSNWKIQSVETTISSNYLVEGIEMFAGRNGSLITQVNSLGGTHEVPFDLSSQEFDGLVGYVLYVGDQRRIFQFFPRALSEIRDGATLVLIYRDISYFSSIQKAEEVKNSVNFEYGLSLQPLFGISDGNKHTLAFYDALSSDDLSNWILNDFPVVPTGPFTGTQIRSYLNEAPVRTTSIVYNRVTDTNFPDGWQIFNSAAFVSPNAININVSNIYNLSLASVFGVDTFTTLTKSNYTEMTLKMPYVANIYSINPETDNLFPELTGKFTWSLKVDLSVWPTINYDRTYDDISIVYDLNITDVKTFPQVEATTNVDFDALINNNVLNYTISMFNSGTEAAKNLNFLQELGDREDPFIATVFNDQVYFYNDSLVVYYDYNNTGQVVTTEPSYFDTFNMTFVGWFQYVENGSLVQPAVNLNQNPTYFIKYELNYTETFGKLNSQKTIFDISYSSNFNEVDLGNNKYGIEGNVSNLDPGQTEKFWWAINNIPSESDNVYIFNANVVQLNRTHLYNDTYEIDWYIDENLNYRDFVFEYFLNALGDLRFPPGLAQLGIIPGLKFRYEDTASREYFGMSNGLSVQLYDDEAILVAKVSSDKQIYEAGEDVIITFNITNVGNIKATDVSLIANHAFLKADWEFGDVAEFYHADSIQEILPGESKLLNWTGKADTFLGIHPVFAWVDYTTDDGQGTGWNGSFRYQKLMSNVVNALVIPPDSKAGTDEPSFPTPELNVTTNILIPDNVSVGDTIEVEVEINNMGDELTHIKAYSYFWNENVELVANAYQNIGTINLLDSTGTNIGGYSQGYIHDDDFKITYVGVEDVALGPNETIFMYFSLKVSDDGDFTLPPVVVEYDSKYPMDILSGEESTNVDDSSGSYLQKAQFKLNSDANLNRNFKTSGTFAAVAKFSSSGNPVESTFAPNDSETTKTRLTQSQDPNSNSSDSVPGYEIYTLVFSVFVVFLGKKNKRN